MLLNQISVHSRDRFKKLSDLNDKFEFLNQVHLYPRELRNKKNWNMNQSL